MEFDRKRDDPLFGPVLSTLHELVGHDEPAPAGVPHTPTGPGDPTALLPWMDDFIGSGGRAHDETPAKRTEHPAPDKRVAEVELGKPGGPRYDPRFVPMAHGSIHETAAPSALRLPDGIVKGLDEAYTKSNTTDHKERGGNLVKTYWGGNYEVRHGGEDSENDSFQPNRKDVRTGQEFIGTYHTHDYTHDKDPYEYGTFSGQDMANMADLEDRMKFVRSGKNTYMLARTKEFDALAKKSENDPEAHLAFQAEMMGTYEKAYAAALKGDKKNHQAALEAATQATAAKYHLLYYQGQGAKLHRTGGPAKP